MGRNFHFTILRSILYLINIISYSLFQITKSPKLNVKPNRIETDHITMRRRQDTQVHKKTLHDTKQKQKEITSQQKANLKNIREIYKQ